MPRYYGCWSIGYKFQMLLDVQIGRNYFFLGSSLEEKYRVWYPPRICFVFISPNTSVVCAIGPSFITSSTDFSFQKT
jgi:hypothetical protein